MPQKYTQKSPTQEFQGSATVSGSITKNYSNYKNRRDQQVHHNQYTQKSPIQKSHRSATTPQLVQPEISDTGIPEMSHYTTVVHTEMPEISLYTIVTNILFSVTNHYTTVIVLKIDIHLHQSSPHRNLRVELHFGNFGCCNPVSSYPDKSLNNTVTNK